jgi:hypothetical protein
MQEFSLDVRNQSCRQIRASAVSGVNRLRKLEITLRPLLKADSDATVEAGTAKASLAMLASIGYTPEFDFHQSRISKLSFRAIGGFN